MKKLFYVVFFALSLSAKSQINLEYSNSKDLISKVTFTNYGDKYYSLSVNEDTIKIYNSDWSIFKTILVPDTLSDFLINYGNYPFLDIFLSDNLFNSDGLIEYAICKPILNNSNYYEVSVMNELGNTIHTFADSINSLLGRIIKMDNSFKLQMAINQGSNIYSLPGSLPCNQCNINPSGLVDPQNGWGNSELRVNPNPFNSSLEINYDFLTRQDNPRLILTDILGRELKLLSLSNQSDRITLNTSDLPKGTIIVNLLGSGQKVMSKKVIKID